mmetsp:Transcript_6634/g.14712  ORF Transcript_6634/g.14712 Transcript_6634/m.14712 type:complete len:554 (+) Transcript_6634:103-1764(+)
MATTIMQNGYRFSGMMGCGGVSEYQGFLTSKAEVKDWVDSGSFGPFLESVDFDSGEIAFVYTHTHTGSGSDDPDVRIGIQEEGILDVQWYDKSRSCFQTADLCFRHLAVAICLNPNVIKSIHTHGLQVKTHTFVVGGVTDEASAFVALRGLDELKSKTDEELKALTFLTIGNADNERVLQALPYLPKLEALSTIGIHWTTKTLAFLSKAATLKKLRVGGRYWAEPNNFGYNDLETLVPLVNLESLNMSYTSIDGNKGDSCMVGNDTDDETGDENAHKPTREQKLSREFARGMRTILKFPKLRKLTLGTQMYPKGAKFLTMHPTLTAIHGVTRLSYEVAEILASSRLSKQITSLDFKYVQHNQMAGPIIAQIAKFSNLIHLGMRDFGRALNDTAMKELAPLVNLKELYIPDSSIASNGLRSLRHLPNIHVLSLGYCRNIVGGLENIQHLNLTHLDLRSIRGLRTEHLLPVLRVSPNLIDLNLRYAEGIDANALAKEARLLKKLEFLNVLSISNASEALKGINVKEYNEDQPFCKGSTAEGQQEKYDSDEDDDDD